MEVIRETARAIEPGPICHALNRGNGGSKSCRGEGDDGDFEKILAEGLQRHPVERLTYGLMANHRRLALKAQEAVLAG